MVDPRRSAACSFWRNVATSQPAVLPSTAAHAGSALAHSGNVCSISCVGLARGAWSMLCSTQLRGGSACQLCLLRGNRHPHQAATGAQQLQVKARCVPSLLSGTGTELFQGSNLVGLTCRYPVRVAVIDLDNPPDWWESCTPEHLTADQARSTAGTTGEQLAGLQLASV